MTYFYIEPKAKKYAKGYKFLSLARNLLNNMENNYWILLLEQY